MPRVPRLLLSLAALTGALGLLIAWVLQHAYGYAPCPWCTLQRLIVMLIVLLCLVGLLLPREGARQALAALAVLGALLGLSAALYQHFVAAKSASCNLTLADRILSALGLPDLWPAMFEASARCDEADLPWLGIPFSLWGALLFGALGLMAALALRRRTSNLIFLKK